MQTNGKGSGRKSVKETLTREEIILINYWNWIVFWPLNFIEYLEEVLTSAIFYLADIFSSLYPLKCLIDSWSSSNYENWQSKDVEIHLPLTKTVVVKQFNSIHV